MIVNAQTLDFLFYQADFRYQATLLKTPSFAEQIASVVPSSTRENHYGWIGRIPKIREWIGERQVNNLASRSYVLVNKEWEDTVGIKRVDIEDDQFGLFNMGVDMLAMQAKIWPDRLITDILRNGHTSGLPYQAYDGQPFFSASHPVNVDQPATTFSNYSSTGMALTGANYQTVRQNMGAFVGEDGSPLGIIPNVLMVPPQLEQQGRQILNADFIAPAAAIGQNAASVMQSNTLKGSAELIVNPWLAGDATTWYLFSAQFPIKPFVFQLRQAPEFVYKTNPNDDESVWRVNQFQYGVYARGNAGFSLPFLAYKAVA